MINVSSYGKYGRDINFIVNSFFRILDDIAYFIYEFIEGMIENVCETSEELVNLRTNHEYVLMQLAAANERIKDLENKNKELNNK